MKTERYGPEGRRCDWPGCRETTQNPTEGDWTLGGMGEDIGKFLPKGFPYSFYAVCPLHSRMLEAACDAVIEEDAAR